MEVGLGRGPTLYSSMTGLSRSPLDRICTFTFQDHCELFYAGQHAMLSR